MATRMPESPKGSAAARCGTARRGQSVLMGGEQRPLSRVVRATSRATTNRKRRPHCCERLTRSTYHAWELSVCLVRSEQWLDAVLQVRVGIVRAHIFSLILAGRADCFGSVL